MKLKLLIHIFLLLIGLLWGCSPVKFVPEDQYLLHKNIISHDAVDIPNDQLKGLIRPKENKTIFGFWHFYLGLYNLSGRNGDNGMNKWFRRIGEAPVIFDEFMVNKSRNQLKLYLKNKGYFNAIVTDTVIVNEKKRKVNVEYHIKAGKRSYIHTVGYKIIDKNVRNMVYSDTIHSLLRGKKAFDVDLLDKERERIAKFLNTNGYYAFSKDYIYYIADSLRGKYLIRDTIVIASVLRRLPDGRDTTENHSRYKIKDVYFFVDFNPQDALLEESKYTTKFDTLYYKGYYFLYKNKIKFKPNVLINSTYITPGELYDITKVEKTQTLITELNLFRYISINSVNCKIQLIKTATS